MSIPVHNVRERPRAFRNPSPAAHLLPNPYWECTLKKRWWWDSIPQPHNLQSLSTFIVQLTNLLGVFSLCWRANYKIKVHPGTCRPSQTTIVQFWTGFLFLIASQAEWMVNLPLGWGNHVMVFSISSLGRRERGLWSSNSNLIWLVSFEWLSLLTSA